MSVIFFSLGICQKRFCCVVVFTLNDQLLYYSHGVNMAAPHAACISVQ